MPSKKKPAKAAKKPTAKKPAKRAVKAASQRTAKAAPRKAPPRRAVAPARPAPKRPSGVDERAQRMARFSKQVVKEEEAPIAVRTFNEARAGIEQSKQLDIRSGAVRPVPAAKEPAEAPAPRPAQQQAKPPPQPQPEADQDLDAEIQRDLEEMEKGMTPSPKPKIGPLTGQLAVPKRANPLEEEFRVGAPAKKGKKGAPPTKDDLGKIELRMQRGSKDEAIAHASPDYLQRSFNQAAQKGRIGAASSAKAEAAQKPDEFEVAMDKGRKRLDAALTDFGDIEIAQQTRRGSKKVGKLDVDEDDKSDE